VEALFGGSFDPVHVGHLVAAETVGDALGATIRFLPAREQPLKRAARAAHGASPEQRVEMLQLAVAGNPRLAVERIELTLLGADAAAELAAWFEVDALPQLADVVVFARPGAPLPRHPAISRIVEVPALDVSATMIRERVRHARSIRYLVPDAVRDYIAARGLYRK